MPTTSIYGQALAKLPPLSYIVDQRVGEKVIVRNNWQKHIKMLEIPYHVSYSYLLFSNGLYQNQTQVAENVWSQVASQRVVEDNPADGLVKAP